MSFNAKNLTYDQNEPKFLRALRAQYGSGDGLRHERPAARPKRLRTDDEDDAPTYVDGDTNEVVTQAEYDALLHQTPAALDEKIAGSKEDEESTAGRQGAGEVSAAGEVTAASAIAAPGPVNLAAVGDRRKKRRAKVIGGVGAEEVVVATAQGDVDLVLPPPKQLRPSQKKATKKVKLSFDDG
ncbi:MAG: hypothetical protein M1826_002475 [Phylliscum demangeonii]|nr:MAG: hypothetical protein M1826_002475 [Phylliscum demangeonii]